MYHVCVYRVRRCRLPWQRAQAAVCGVEQASETQNTTFSGADLRMRITTSRSRSSRLCIQSDGDRCYHMASRDAGDSVSDEICCHTRACSRSKQRRIGTASATSLALKSHMRRGRSQRLRNAKLPPSAERGPPHGLTCQRFKSVATRRAPRGRRTGTASLLPCLRYIASSMSWWPPGSQALASWLAGSGRAGGWRLSLGCSVHTSWPALRRCPRGFQRASQHRCTVMRTFC